MEGHHKLFWGRKRRSVVEGQKEKGAIFLDGWRRIVMRGTYLEGGGAFWGGTVQTIHLLVACCSTKEITK